MKSVASWIAALLLPCSGFAACDILTAPSAAPDCVTLAGSQGEATIVTDTNDAAVVQLAANFFADDVQRVTGHRPAVANMPAKAASVILAGTLGHSAVIDRLAASGKLADLDKIRGRWEATLWEIVDHPLPGVDRALVIVGSDRRGTAYGFMQLSEKIGVSPWYWWADVPPQHHETLAARVPSPQVDMPGVKYRGFFINDEDWGLNPWASKTFDPKFGNIGPKTYEKVFELMLRLRLNYLWPAMHACSTEFGATPENYLLADKFAIVAGSSHCEPMLCNNVHWNEKEKGPWNYSLNRDTIHSYWEDNVKARGAEEAVWTLGIRGIHDRSMETPPKALPDKIKLVDQVIQDQRELLDRYVATNWGPVAQCFVPYKEVLPIYDAGLKVPDDVTLVWVDDNFGYLRRLSNPAERQRSGGAGVYWHISYYGGPHSYTWIDTTAPALIWEQLHLAWDNDARNLWVINVGDIKPMEIGIDYFSRLAWNPDGFPLGSQREFLRDFATKTFGAKFARPIADLLTEYYWLGTVRKPELMVRSWAMSLSPDRAAQLTSAYQDLLQRERALAAEIPEAERDAYTELVGFPVHVVGDTGLIFMADRQAQLGKAAAADEKEIARLRDDLEAQVKNFNTNIAGGKWDCMMPGLVTGHDLMAWSSQVRWPWGEKNTVTTNPAAPIEASAKWRIAATADHQSAPGLARWSEIEGLGPSGRAMALEPAGLDSAWKVGDAAAPTLEYRFDSPSPNPKASIDFLPTFRIYPGMKLRVAVSVDEQPPVAVEVPCSGGAQNENSAERSQAVQDNYVRVTLPLKIPAGRHTFKIHAVDPGAVIDAVSLP